MIPRVRYARGRRLEEFDRAELEDVASEALGKYLQSLGMGVDNWPPRRPWGKVDPIIPILFAVAALGVLLGMIWTFYLRTV